MIWKSLGAIRFILALIVACGHLGWFVGQGSWVVRIGYYFSAQTAVLGFLVLSGYSIGASYFRQPEHYYARRVLRIVPLYYFCVLVSAFIPVLHGGSIQNARETFTVPDAKTILGNLLFLQGFFVHSVNTNGVVWTLSIEVFFYLVTPFLAKLHLRWIVLATLGSCIAYCLYRYLKLPFFAEMQFGTGIIFMGWAWLMGFWIYRANVNKDLLLAALIIGICVMDFNGSFLGWLWPVTWCITIAGISWGSAVPKNALLERCFQMAGDISYPLYLVHMPCFMVLQIVQKPWPPISWILVSIVVAFLLDRIYDRPAKELLRRGIIDPVTSRLGKPFGLTAGKGA